MSKRANEKADFSTPKKSRMALSMAKEKEKSSNVVVTKASTQNKKISPRTLHPVDDIPDYLCNLNAKR